MSRPIKLIVGLLFLIIAGMFGLLQELVPPERGPVSPAIWGVVAVPGLLAAFALAAGLRSGLTAQEQVYVQMKLFPARIALGLGVTIGSALVLYLFHNVVHIAPHEVVVGALLGVPVGLIWSATAWTEACRKCGTPLDEGKGEAIKYCRRCRAFLLETAKGTRRLVTGDEARNRLAEKPG